MKTTFKISVHTGPLNANQFAQCVEMMRERTAAKNFLCGTERLYFDVDAEGDAIDAHIASRDMLVKAFGPACSFQPVVGNALRAGPACNVPGCTYHADCRVFQASQKA